MFNSRCQINVSCYYYYFNQNCTCQDIEYFCQESWFLSLISVLYKIMASLLYIMSSRTAGDMQRDSVSKKSNKNKYIFIISQKQLLNKISLKIKFKFVANKVYMIFHLTCRLIWKNIRTQIQKRSEKGDNMNGRIKF